MAVLISIAPKYSHTYFTLFVCTCLLFVIKSLAQKQSHCGLSLYTCNGIDGH